MLVGLGIVETTDHGPDGVDRGVDGLDDDGAALVGPHQVGMAASGGFWKREAELSGGDGKEETVVFGADEGVGDGGGIEAVKLRGRLHFEYSEVWEARGGLDGLGWG